MQADESGKDRFVMISIEGMYVGWSETAISAVCNLDGGGIQSRRVLYSPRRV